MPVRAWEHEDEERRSKGQEGCGRARSEREDERERKKSTGPSSHREPKSYLPVESERRPRMIPR